jgi:hypothetical protein
MTTITKTTAQAVSRKLSSLGFDKYDSLTQMGFSVLYGCDGIHVVNHTYKDYEGTAAQELEAAGYVIENRFVNDWSRFLDRKVEVFNVSGRVEA